MLLELIAIISAGFALAGLALMLNFILGKRLPGWIFPAAAGAGMLLMSVWLEYSWLDRIQGTFPAEVEVVSTNKVQSWYRPWTYMVPQVNRLIAIDHRFDRRNPALAGQVLTRVLLVGRWEAARPFAVVFDCTTRSRADLADEVRFADDGSLVDAQWRPLDADDPALMAACRA